MKRILYFTALLAALSVFACNRTPLQRPDTVPLVKTLSADTTLMLAAPDAKGCIAIIGRASDVDSLSLRFTTIDTLDNIDGRKVPDALFDFAGESFLAIHDSSGSDLSEEAAREHTVYLASRLIRERPELQPKLYVLASEGVTPFDLDTLYKMAGFRIDIVTPEDGDIVLATAARLRQNNLYTHRISLPELEYVSE